MSLREIMQRDARCVLRNPRDFGEACRVQPQDHSESFLIAVLVGANPMQQAAMDEGQTNERRATATVDGIEYRSAMWAITGSDRGPIEGDTFLFEDGEHLGQWVVLVTTPIGGDQYSVTLSWVSLQSMGQQRNQR